MKFYLVIFSIAIGFLIAMTIDERYVGQGPKKNARILKMKNSSSFVWEPQPMMYFHYDDDSACYIFMLVNDRGKVLSYIRCDSGKMSIIDSGETISVLMKYIEYFNNEIFTKDSLLQLMRLHNSGSYFAL